MCFPFKKLKTVLLKTLFTIRSWIFHKLLPELLFNINETFLLWKGKPSFPSPVGTVVLPLGQEDKLEIYVWYFESMHLYGFENSIKWGNLYRGFFIFCFSVECQVFRHLLYKMKLLNGSFMNFFNLISLIKFQVQGSLYFYFDGRMTK